MIRKSKNLRRSKRYSNNNNISKGTRGGNHGRLPLPIVTTGGARKAKRMVRSNTRIRPGITSGGGRRRTKRMIRDRTRRRPKSMVRSNTRIRPGITV